MLLKFIFIPLGYNIFSHEDIKTRENLDKCLFCVVAATQGRTDNVHEKLLNGALETTFAYFCSFCCPRQTFSVLKQDQWMEREKIKDGGLSRV